MSDMCGPEKRRDHGQLSCPLCHCSEAAVVCLYQYDAIWERLSGLGARFSGDVIARHTPGPIASLHQCAQCGLQYFSPSVPGNPVFYCELMASIAYLPGRYEFDVVAGQLRGAGSVIDLGCGQGGFLRTLKARRPDLRLAGVDHNANAIAGLRADGIEGHTGDVTDFASREEDSFDVVCAFQILEHVGDPMSLVKAAARLLSPFGRLFVSVPHRERLLREPLEPLDCPPHHVTRWSPDQFKYLAQNLGLALESVSFETPHLSDVRVRHWRDAERWFGRCGPRTALLAARVNSRLRVPQRKHVWSVRRGTYPGRGVFAHTMLAELRRCA